MLRLAWLLGLVIACSGEPTEHAATSDTGSGGTASAGSSGDGGAPDSETGGAPAGEAGDGGDGGRAGGTGGAGNNGGRGGSHASGAGGVDPSGGTSGSAGAAAGSGGAGGSTGGGGSGGGSGAGGSGGSGDELELVWEITRTGENASNNLVAYYRIYVTISYPEEQYPNSDPPECGRFGFDDELASGYEGTRTIPLDELDNYCFSALGTVAFAVPVQGFYSNGNLLSTNPNTMSRPSKPVDEDWNLVELRHIVRELTITPGPTNPEAKRYIDETWQLWGKPL